MKFFDLKMWFYDFIKWTGALPVAIDLRPKLIYETDKAKSAIYNGSYLISCNHGSFIDPIIVSAAFAWRRLYFIATKDFFRTPFWAFVFSHVNCIPIDKDNVQIETFKTVKDKTLNEGRPVCIFPEGSVNTENLGKYKSGVVMMAVMSGCEILPVYICKRKRISIHRQVIVIGDRIDYRNYISGKFPTMQEIERITEILTEKENHLKSLFKED